MSDEGKQIIMDAAVNMFGGDDYLIEKFLDEYGYYDEDSEIGEVEYE